MISQAVHLSTGSHLKASLGPTHEREDDAEVGEGVEDQSDRSEDAETLGQELVELWSVKRGRVNVVQNVVDGQEMTAHLGW